MLTPVEQITCRIKQIINGKNDKRRIDQLINYSEEQNEITLDRTRK